MSDLTATLPVKYPHIEKSADGPARLESLPRIRVAQIVMDYLAHGWSVEEICKHYPHLNLAETHAAMSYYFDHRDEIDEEIRREWREYIEARDRTSPSPFYLRMKAKGIL